MKALPNFRHLTFQKRCRDAVSASRERMGWQASETVGDAPKPPQRLLLVEDGSKPPPR